MDGEMIKTAARYVGTSTIIRHLASRDSLLAGLEKEAAVGEKFLAWGKKLFSRPSSPGRVVSKRVPQLLKEGPRGDAAEFGERLMHPLYGMRKGWQEMSGVSARAREVDKLTDRIVYARKTGRPDIAKKFEEKLMKYEAKTPHLEEASRSLGEAWRGGRVKGVAEELSRRGWTGQGSRMKYLPVSQKAMMTGFAASDIPGIVNAPAATPTGEGGALERLGSTLGGTAGWIAGSGRIGLLPSVALWMAGEKAGKSIGRFADRTRAGASPLRAATAPSPEEAREQLAKIYQTYGG